MQSTRRRLLALTLLGLLAVGGGYLGGWAAADGIPTAPTLYYSGFLEESGTPVAGARRVEISFWSDETSGSELCSTVVANAAFDAGNFRVALSDTCVGVVQDETEVWAEVDVGGEVLPRTRLGAVPYAVEAGRAAAASGGLADRQSWSALFSTNGAVDVQRPTGWTSNATFIAGANAHYVIPFNRTFSRVPACTVNIVSGAGIANCEAANILTTSTEVWCRLNPTNQAVDAAFFLICFGD